MMKHTTRKKFLCLLILVLPGVLMAKEKTDKEEVSRELSEAVDAIKRYSVTQKDEAVEKARVTMDDLDKRIERLEDRIDTKWDQMDESARKTARETLRRLQEERNELSEWYGGLQQSSSEAWGHVKRGFVESYQVLRESLGDAKRAYNGDEEK